MLSIMAIFNALLRLPTNVKFESQESTEKVHFILRKHPITNLGWILGSLLMIIIPVIAINYLEYNRIDSFDYVPAKYQLAMILLWYLLTMLYTLESFLVWYFNVYIITDKRIVDIDFRGFWKKRISEASLGNVEDATYQTGHFWHILFDYGDIAMQTAGEKTEFEFSAVPKPGLVHDVLTNLVAEFKNANNSNKK